MKKKIIFFSLVLISFMWVCSTRAPEGTFEWKGTIEYRDGIKVVIHSEEMTGGTVIQRFKIDNWSDMRESLQSYIDQVSIFHFSLYS